MNPMKFLDLIKLPLVKWFGIGSLIAIALLTTALGITRNTLHNVRQANKLAEQTRIAVAAKREAKWQAKLSDERGKYAADQANRQPIIIRSKDTIREYAQTDAGRVACLDANRVRGIDGFDTDIAATANRGTAAVLDPASAAPK